VVFIILILRLLAAGGSPSGKPKVKAYQNQKGQKTKMLHVWHWFYIKGAGFNDAGGVNEVCCWETNEAASNPSWTAVSTFNVLDSKTIQVWIDNDECGGSQWSENGGGPIAVEWVAGNFIVGPAASINLNVNA
jgi:hypothetical protein